MSDSSSIRFSTALLHNSLAKKHHSEAFGRKLASSHAVLSNWLVSDDFSSRNSVELLVCAADAMLEVHNCRRIDLTLPACVSDSLVTKLPAIAAEQPTNATATAAVCRILSAVPPATPPRSVVLAVCGVAASFPIVPGLASVAADMARAWPEPVDVYPLDALTATAMTLLDATLTHPAPAPAEGLASTTRAIRAVLADDAPTGDALALFHALLGPNTGQTITDLCQYSPKVGSPQAATVSHLLAAMATTPDLPHTEDGLQFIVSLQAVLGAAIACPATGPAAVKAAASLISCPLLRDDVFIFHLARDVIVTVFAPVHRRRLKGNLWCFASVCRALASVLADPEQYDVVEPADLVAGLRELLTDVLTTTLPEILTKSLHQRWFSTMHVYRALASLAPFVPLLLTGSAVDGIYRMAVEGLVAGTTTSEPADWVLAVPGLHQIQWNAVIAVRELMHHAPPSGTMRGVLVDVVAVVRRLSDDHIVMEKLDGLDLG